MTKPALKIKLGRRHFFTVTWAKRGWTWWNDTKDGYRVHDLFSVSYNELEAGNCITLTCMKFHCGVFWCKVVQP